MTTGLAVSLYLSGAWTDVSSYVYARDKVRITRNRQNEGSGAQASTCSLTFDNRDGRFSPRNPSGAYYGAIGRNTPIKVETAEGAPYLLLNGSSAYISTPDSVPLSITGDLELQVDIWLPDNRYLWDLCNKYGGAGARSWALQINAGGTVSLTGGTAIITPSLPAPVPVSPPTGGAIGTDPTADPSWRSAADSCPRSGRTLDRTCHDRWCAHH